MTQRGEPYRVVVARDEEMLDESQWKDASQFTSEQLNRKVRVFIMFILGLGRVRINEIKLSMILVRGYLL